MNAQIVVIWYKKIKSTHFYDTHCMKDNLSQSFITDFVISSVWIKIIFYMSHDQILQKCQLTHTLFMSFHGLFTLWTTPDLLFTLFLRFSGVDLTCYLRPNSYCKSITFVACSLYPLKRCFYSSFSFRGFPSGFFICLIKTVCTLKAPLN